MALTDSAGAVVNTYNYDVFGAIRSSTGSQANAFTFTGEQTDGSTGLEYLRARYYDPAVGRFISRDRLAGAIVAPQTMNRFVYVLNNPVRFRDPLGLSPIEGTVDWLIVDALVICIQMGLWCDSDMSHGMAAEIIAQNTPGVTVGVSCQILDPCGNPVDDSLFAASFLVPGARGGRILGNLTSRQIVREVIGPQQRRLLNEFFGTGLPGALAREADFVVPAGLTRTSLEAYSEIALRAIEGGRDNLGVQAVRLRLIERALQGMAR